MFWNDEDAITVVPAVNLKEAIVGEIREVTMGKNTCSGRVTAIGNI